MGGGCGWGPLASSQRLQCSLPLHPPPPSPLRLTHVQVMSAGSLPPELYSAICAFNEDLLRQEAGGRAILVSRLVELVQVRLGVWCVWRVCMSMHVRVVRVCAWPRACLRVHSRCVGWCVRRVRRSREAPSHAAGEAARKRPLTKH